MDDLADTIAALLDDAAAQSDPLECARVGAALRALVDASDFRASAIRERLRGSLGNAECDEDRAEQAIDLARAPVAYQAIKWRHDPAGAREMGPWRPSQDFALEDYEWGYCPHDRAMYAIRGSDGSEFEPDDEWYDRARDCYARQIEERNARGVWG